MGCGDSKPTVGTPAAIPANKDAPTLLAQKQPVGSRPGPGDIVTVSGQEAKVLKATTTDYEIEYKGSGKVAWVDAEEVIVTKGKLPLAEVKPGVEITTIEGSKGKVTKRTTTEIYFKPDKGEETFVDVESITVVKVTVVSATNLANKDMLSKSDPYVTCQLAAKPQSRVQTPMVKDNLNPEWNFEAGLLGYTTGDAVVFEVWDKDMITDEYLGKCTLEHDKFHGTDFVGELQLLDKKGERGQGSLQIRVSTENAAPLKVQVPEQKFEAESRQVKPSPWGCC